jgi:hypothetical protein
VKDSLLRLRGLIIAIMALALSAGLAFGAEPPSSAAFGLTTAASHAGKTVPVQGGAGEEDTDEDLDEDTEEGTEEDIDEDLEGDAEGAGENCSTDPTALTDEELALMKRGSIVCWAAHQTTWPEEFKNHGAFVSDWAHWDRDDEDSEDDEDSDELGATSAGNGHGKGNGNGKGKAKNR